MKIRPDMSEIYLKPGEVRFGDRDTRIRTLLGSCVAITVWHPRLLIGGMCHYMLASRGGRPAGAAFNGCYADEALDLLLGEIRAAGTRPHEYQVKMFGGGNMFPGMKLAHGCSAVSMNNIRAGRQLVRSHGFKVSGQHMGGAGHRTIIFDIRSGDVWLKFRQSAVVDTCEDCDRRALCEPV